MNTGAEGTAGRPVDCNLARRGCLASVKRLLAALASLEAELRARLAPRWQHENIGLA